MIETIFENYYKDNKQVEHQIIKHLIEDVLTCHYNLKEVDVKLYNKLNK